MTIKKALISFFVITAVSSLQASDLLHYSHEASDRELKKAVGKTILNQQKLISNQEYLYSEVSSLKKEIQELKKAIHEQKAIKTNQLVKTEVANLNARTIYSFTNIREQPSFRAKIKRTLKENTFLLIEKCELNSVNARWCKLSNEDSFIRDYTIEFVQN